MRPRTGSGCLFCGASSTGPDHHRYCDGKQGRIEAAIEAEHFDGETYDPARDHDRLHAQLRRVLSRMRDHGWHTLTDISNSTGDPQASVSARLRDLRKEKFGGYRIDRQYVSDGLWEYRLVEHQ